MIKIASHFFYGYQGQEKSQNDVNWDNFELRTYNHDLGRWSAPDPYGQFHSPYLAMGNDPVNNIDPDGGFMNPWHEGDQRQTWINIGNAQRSQDYDLWLRHLGQYSESAMYESYNEKLASLYAITYGGGVRGETSGDGGGLDNQYLTALNGLNSEYMGMGLSGAILSNGVGSVGSCASPDLICANIQQTGTGGFDEAQAGLAGFRAATDAYNIMTPSGRREAMMNSGVVSVYRLAYAYSWKRVQGKGKDSETGEHDDITDEKVYCFVNDGGDKFKTFVNNDGSAWFDKSKENQAYIYMNLLSKTQSKEVGAFITASGIYVPNSRKNEFGKCWSIVNTKLNFINGSPYLYYNKQSYAVIGAIHTHPMLPSGNPDQGMSNADYGFAKYLNKPFFSMAWDGFFDGAYYKNNILYVYPTGINTTSNLYDGSYSLIKRLK